MSGADGKSGFDPQAFLKTLTSRPGVYQMIGADEEVLYVGKAANLKKRVSSYFQKRIQDPKTRVMLSHVQEVQVTVTRSEAEALLLEYNLINRHRPRYNVIWRDDKSYPYIYASTDQTFPRLVLHRGTRKGKGRYFGPYPNAGAARQSINLLQKLFRIRGCRDSFFRNRTRPCLQYQIKRCTGPCVGLIGEQDYRRDVDDAVMFLEGRSAALIDEQIHRMEAAAERLDYELAAIYRDRIEQLRRISDRTYVSGETGDVDIVACVVEGGMACVQVFFVRKGQSLGNKAFFPKTPPNTAATEVLGSFLAQFYLRHEIPREIIVNMAIEEADLIVGVLSDKCGHKVSVSHKVRGHRARWQEMAIENARLAIGARIASRAGLTERFEALQDELGLPELPQRLECFDISHTMGEATVASCVVFDPEGPSKSDYRRFNITGITPGDDYAAMRQALERRYKRLKAGEGKLPDVLFIDGGKGQVHEALVVLEELQVQGVQVVGVAKGVTRRPGLESLIREDGSAVHLPANSPALHLIQQIRDEAHRFAITGHRQRRGKARTTSPLEGIPGIGPKRRQVLLKQFGGLRGLSRASVEELSRVEGVSRSMAQEIYDMLHSE
jgi:excinuclease ABC subunit C